MGYFDALKDKKQPPAGLHVVTTTTDPARGTAYAQKALASEADLVANAPEGRRNHTLNIAALKLGTLIAAGQLDRDTVETTLGTAAQTAGLDLTEIRGTLASGLRKGLEEPRIIPDQTPPPTPTILDELPEDATEDQIAALIRSKFPIIDWQELWDTEDEEEEWIVEPILPARRLVALFSAPKVGKSLLMLEIAAKVAQGEPILGHPAAPPRRVLYVDFENDPRGDIRQRLRAMRIEPHTLANLCYLSYPTMAKLDTATGAQELLAAAQTYECDLVVIDTISRAVQGEENENDTWLAFYRHTGLALKQAGIACIRLDHTGKDHDKGMRGGSAKYGDVDAVWKLSKITDETYRLDCTDHRMRLTETSIVLTRQHLPRLTHEVSTEGRAAVHRAKLADLLAVLDAAGVDRDASRKDARAALKAAGRSASNELIGEALDQRRLRLP